MVRIVIDTNIWLSGLISQKMRDRLEALIGRADIVMVGSLELLMELEETAKPPKLAKYVNPENRAAYMQIIRSRLDMVEPKQRVRVCRDPDDDFLIALCLEGHANFLISGDQDLLSLKSYEEVSILSLTEFEEVLAKLHA